MFEKLLSYDVAHLILGEYMSYYHQFKRITKRARIRFEHRDWPGIQADALERIALYRQEVGETTLKVQEKIGKEVNNPDVWREIKRMYFEDIMNFNTRNIAETFYNSIFRHSFQNEVVDEELMFVHATGTYREFRSTQPIFHTFYWTPDIAMTMRQLLSLYHFDVPYQDMERDVSYLTETLLATFSKEVLTQSARLEVLRSIFFRNKGAYIVGRLFIHEKPIPFVLPLLHAESGVYVDSLLLEYNDVSSIFSYNRSYFLVDVDIVSETVDFLRSILPTKSLGELYNSIGFEKHGKTVFYRDFLRHLTASSDQFVEAPGIRGMVMMVFTLPSYDMVFKLIKDEFAPPKKVTEEEVKEKYRLVNRHDRVGRMADSHMFENLALERSRFHPELLELLLEVAPGKVKVRDEQVLISHLYVEKRMIPLNIYLQEQTEPAARAAIDEYGKAIKQMAAVNIFPGDMLLKNFGVTRLKRVVFYDYDEIGFLTDYQFRRIPEPRDEYEELSSEPYFHVGPNDIFPEEFVRFLIGDPKIRSLFQEIHGDLYDVQFWRETQKKLGRGEMLDVYPYDEGLRFTHRYAPTT